MKFHLLLIVKCGEIHQNQKNYKNKGYNTNLTKVDVQKTCVYGGGIFHITNTVLEAGLREPEFIGGDVDLRINIYRECDTIRDTIDTNKTQHLEEKLLEQIQLHPHFTQREYAYLLGVSIATIKRLFKKLQKAKYIERKGTNRSGKWIISR